MEIASFTKSDRWREWFAWRPVLVADVEPDSDWWRFYPDKVAHKLIWLQRVQRRPIRSISEQRQPFTMFVYKPPHPSPAGQQPLTPSD